MFASGNIEASINTGVHTKFSSSSYFFPFYEKISYIMKDRGRYLQRRIPHASHGSFKRSWSFYAKREKLVSLFIALCNNEMIKKYKFIRYLYYLPNLGSHCIWELCFRVNTAKWQNTFLWFVPQHSGDVSVLQHFGILPKCLLIELASTCINQVYFTCTMDIWTRRHGTLCKSSLYCRNTHTEWIYIDYLWVSVRSFTSSIQNILNNYPNDWLFAVFEKSSSTIHAILIYRQMPSSDHAGKNTNSAA